MDDRLIKYMYTNDAAVSHVLTVHLIAESITSLCILVLSAFSAAA